MGEKKFSFFDLIVILIVCATNGSGIIGTIFLIGMYPESLVVIVSIFFTIAYIIAATLIFYECMYRAHLYSKYKPLYDKLKNKGK